MLMLFNQNMFSCVKLQCIVLPCTLLQEYVLVSFGKTLEEISTSSEFM